MIELIVSLALLSSSFIQALHIVYALGYWGSLRGPGEVGRAPLDLPRASVVIPVKGEPAEILRATLRSCASLEWPRERLEILVVSDDPPEARGEILEAVEEISSTGLRARAVFRDAPVDGRAGALNEALGQASGEILLFLDVDTRPSPRILARAWDMISMGCDAVVFRWRGYYIYPTRLAKALSLATDFIVGVLYRGRGGYGLYQIPLGSGTVYRREVLLRVSGWERGVVQDDYWMGLKLAGLGARTCYCDDESVEVLVTSTYRAFKIQQSRWSFGAVQAVRRGLGILSRSPLSPLLRAELALYGLQYSPTILIAFSTYAYPLALLAHQGRDPLLSVLPLFIAWIAVSTLYIAVYLYIVVQRSGAGLAKAAKMLGTSSAATASLAPIIALNQILGAVSNGYRYITTPKGSKELGGRGWVSEIPEISSALILSAGLATALAKGYLLSVLLLTVMLAPYLYVLTLILALDEATFNYIVERQQASEQQQLSIT